WETAAGAPPGAVAHATGANAYGEYSATPYLRLPAHPGRAQLLVTLVVLSADPERPCDPQALRAEANARVTPGGGVLIRFPDGAEEEVPAAAGIG
ncbi:hypothetical protein G5C60_50860, partial [Streptomyces sp. HC44]|nr:hypothetical protein [Streptomyces scabichelini]